MVNDKLHRYIIAGLQIEVSIVSKKLTLDSNGGSGFFNVSKFSQSVPDFRFVYNVVSENEKGFEKPSFSGHSFESLELPYYWEVYKNHDNVILYIEFKKAERIKSIKAELDLKNGTVAVDLAIVAAALPIAIDPFLHPLGVLLLHYMVNAGNGLLVHASGVEMNNRGFLFTAVSGTGKSTMARLWERKGATIINDDRLAIVLEGDTFCIHNTPMPFYQDRSKSVSLDGIFIINQSETDYIKKLPLAKGAVKFLSNCIQHQYDEAQVKHYLGVIHQIAQSVPIYELGFRPTTAIVDFINAKFKNK
ncbi:hypothetical protein DMA11_01180 [Marinilabiliaceae bacterium JC017]|nr:hypothetical protein DMA11_01180 [Marinilabiliaceae bacterium JC017]